MRIGTLAFIALSSLLLVRCGGSSGQPADAISTDVPGDGVGTDLPDGTTTDLPADVPIDPAGTDLPIDTPDVAGDLSADGSDSTTTDTQGDVTNDTPDAAPGVPAVKAAHMSGTWCDVNAGQAATRTISNVSCDWQGWTGHCLALANADADPSLTTYVDCSADTFSSTIMAGRQVFDDLTGATFQDAYGTPHAASRPFSHLGRRYDTIFTQRTDGGGSNVLFGWLFQGFDQASSFSLLTPNPVELDYSANTQPALGVTGDRVFGVYVPPGTTSIHSLSVQVPQTEDTPWTDAVLPDVACPAGTVSGSAIVCREAEPFSARGVVVTCLDGTGDTIGTVVLKTKDGVAFQQATLSTGVATAISSYGGLGNCFTRGDDLYVTYAWWDGNGGLWHVGLYRFKDGTLPWDTDVYGGPRSITDLPADPRAQVSFTKFLTDGTTHWILLRTEGSGVPTLDRFGRSTDEGQTWSFHDEPDGTEMPDFVLTQAGFNIPENEFILVRELIQLGGSPRKGTPEFLYGYDPASPTQVDVTMGDIAIPAGFTGRMHLDNEVAVYAYMPWSDSGGPTQMQIQLFNVGH